mmetsp:Transcript_34561/g.81931  ORF Transcript_34561/g.81931 Transcript_34561/m.81931 type:complete len:114 (+) Transcript_34561:1243-1584(+)
MSQSSSPGNETLESDDMPCNDVVADPPSLCTVLSRTVSRLNRPSLEAIAACPVRPPFSHETGASDRELWLDVTGGGACIHGKEVEDSPAVCHGITDGASVVLLPPAGMRRVRL